MSTASIPGRPLFAPRTTAQAEPRARPEPTRPHIPVFIGDAVTPLGGETLLSLMMKRMMQDAPDNPS